MKTELAIPFLIFLGLFFLYRKILWVTLVPILKALLNGPFKNVSVNYFKDFAKRHFDAASQKNDPSRAWEEIALEKVREIGHSRVSYENRRRNLLYLKSAPPNKRVAVGLIDVMPLQRDLRFQQEIACFVCSLLEKLGNNIKSDQIHPGFILKSLNAPLLSWNDIFSAWAATITLSLFGWNSLDDYPPLILGMLCILIVGFMVFPITKVNIKPASMLAYFLFSIFAILAFLALYAYVNHSGVNHVETNLSSLGYQTKISVNYPKWLIFEDIQSCHKSNTISVLVENGTLPGVITFDYDDQLFSARNSECNAFVPIVDSNNTANQAFEFYLMPLDLKSDFGRKLDITPTLRLPNNHEIPLEEIGIHTNIEPTYWRVIRSLIIYIASGGSLNIFYIVAQIVTSLRGKEK